MGKSMAVENLMVRNIFIRDFQQQVNKDFQPALDENEVITQSKHGYGHGCLVTEYKADEDLPAFYIYRFQYECGIRVVNPDSNPDEPEVLLELEATFVADYQSEKMIEKDEIGDFGERYVGYHVWPYWREFVQSSLTKSGLPAVSIPVFRVKAA